MTQHEFELQALGRKAPEISQLYIAFLAIELMTPERAKSYLQELCLACCRLQMELEFTKMYDEAVSEMAKAQQELAREKGCSGR